MIVRFGLLGPIGLISDTGFRPISGTHVRGMLAALLLRPNTMLSWSELMTDLWDRPPTSATDNLRKFRMRLHRQLAATHHSLADRLTTFRGGGYSLRVEPYERDVEPFRARWECGRAALAVGDHHEATPQLAAAVSMWRGPTGLDTPPDGQLTRRLDSLNQMLAEAMEDLAAARIGIGHHAEVVDTLRSQLAVDPSRERAAGLLLLALYRVGDVAGALASFRDVRDYLADELGVHPGKSLRALHQAVLQRDDELLLGDECLLPLWRMTATRNATNKAAAG